jgi:hypothetical protein
VGHLVRREKSQVLMILLDKVKNFKNSLKKADFFTLYLLDNAH